MGASTKTKAAKRGEAASMEMRGTSRSKPPTVHFEDEDNNLVVSSDGESVGEVMEVVASGNSKAVHPITVMIFPKKNGRVACRALLDQCFMDEGLISYALADTLGLSGVMAHPKSFMTAACTFTTNHTVRINDVMLPCLLQNHTFTIILMVIPWGCIIEMTYGVIVEQESM